MTSSGAERPSLRCLLAQDRDAGLQLRRLDVGEQAPLEARTHAVLEAGQLLGRQVGGDHDLLVVVVQRVEGVEELLLRPVLARQELDVVDEQDVDVAVRRLEARSFVVADGVDEVVGELLGVHVAHADAVVEVAGVVADRVQQVGLAQPGVAVDEQRVVGLGGGFGHGDGRGVREAVRGADHEGVEDVLRVQPAELMRGARRHGLRLLLDQLVRREDGSTTGSGSHGWAPDRCRHRWHRGCRRRTPCAARRPGRP